MLINRPSKVSNYLEVGNIGQTTTDTTAYSLGGGDFKSVYGITVPVGGIWFKNVVLNLQQVAAGGHIRPIIYSAASSAGAIVVQGQDIALSAQGANSSGVITTVSFLSSGAATFLAAGTYGLCIHASGTLIDVKSSAGSVLWNADTYSDGPTDPYGATNSAARTPQIYLPYSVGGP